MSLGLHKLYNMDTSTILFSNFIWPRIQKLLCTEYREFNELVLIESPFAQTTRDGNGIRQLQIGLSPTKLILACDYPSQDSSPWNGGDPEIESLELLSIVPLESVTLTVFRRRTRNTIKAHFSNDRILFFELAASNRREMFWNLWCDRMRLLAPELISSTQSETSIGSSSSSMTNYIRPHSSIGDNSWQERNLYLGPHFGSWATKKRKQPRGSPHVPHEADPTTFKGGEKKVYQVNRFGAGVSENCSTSLFLPAQVIVAQGFLDQDLMKDKNDDSWQLAALEEAAVQRWERATILRHPRRYALSTMPHLMAGLGLWALPSPQAAMVQLRRWSSEVTLNTRDPVLSTCIPKRLLISTVSSESLLRYRRQHSPPVMFWTPGYWYKPRFVCKAYSEQREHLNTIQTSIREGHPKRRGWLKGFKKKQIATVHHGGWGDGPVKKSDFRTQLIADIALSSWDFDSTLIAYQITLIDRDLFIRIPAPEFQVLQNERNTRNTPNFRAMVAFSNRLTNLITTEVIRIDSIKMRARLLARWINVTDKLFRLQNMQGVRSILAGMQSTGVYRLTGTWSYLRHHHNSKYRRLTTLMRLNRDPRSKTYRQMMTQVIKTTPYMLSAEYLVAILLGWTSPPLVIEGNPGAIEWFLPTWVSAAMEYGLTETPLAREFLTKARYLEELDNFVLASQLEPTIQVPSQQ